MVVVATDDEQGRALARALAAEGAGVIVAAADPAAGGRLATELADAGARVAVLSLGSDPAADVDAIVELAGELSRS